MSEASAYEQLVLELINAERAKVGAQPLAMNSNLNTSSELQSRYFFLDDEEIGIGRELAARNVRVTSQFYTVDDHL